jgi:hypothetical protein
MARLLRVFLIVGAVQGYAIGLTGLLTPASIVGFPLETTPLNDRFVASFYLAGAIGLTLTALVASPDDTRVLVWAFSFVTLLLLVVTLAYWSEFTVDGVPYPWLVSYIVDPVVGATLIVALRLWSRAPLRHRGVGLVLLVEATVFGGLGLLMLAAPSAAIDIWPWNLTTILARVYGAIFVALALGALLAARESRPPALIPFLATSFVFCACGVAIFLLHHSRFDGSFATVLWVVAHGAGVLVFGGALAAVIRSRAPNAAVASAQ